MAWSRARRRATSRGASSAAQAQPPGELARGWQSLERVEAEARERVLVLGPLLEADAAETARVGHREARAVLHGDLDLPEARPRGPVAVDLEGAGHAEVEQGPRPAVELHPEVLALPADGQDAPAAQRGGEARRRYAVVHDRVGGDGHSGDAQAAQGPLGATPGGLDLG